MDVNGVMLHMEESPPHYFHSFLWTIPDFVNVTNQKVTSPLFAVDVRYDNATQISSKWFLELYPFGFKPNGYLALYLVLDSCEQGEIEGDFQCSIIDESETHRNVAMMYANSDHLFIPNNTKDSRTGWKKYVQREQLIRSGETLLHEGALKICCILKINIPLRHQDRRGQRKCRKRKIDFETSDAFWQMFTKHKYSDVTFKVGGQEFRLHKAVMAQCPVFAAMFDSNMEESQTNEVIITDVEPQVFEEMIRYIYTKSVRDLEALASKLIVCADKYNLQCLLSACEESIRQGITANSAAEVFRLAGHLRLEGLKKHALKYIARHGQEVMETEGWKELEPALVKEVAMELARKLKNVIDG